MWFSFRSSVLSFIYFQMTPRTMAQECSQVRRACCFTIGLGASRALTDRSQGGYSASLKENAGSGLPESGSRLEWTVG
jgi:hypothetical protein